MARYIDIDKAMPFIDEMGKKYCMTPCNILTCKEILAKVPIADVQEVRHGHWIEDKETGSLICSECCHFTDEIIGDFVYADEETAKALSIPKGATIHRSMNPIYCSRCGAKMDGEQAEVENKEIEEKK